MPTIQPLERREFAHCYSDLRHPAALTSSGGLQPPLTAGELRGLLFCILLFFPAMTSAATVPALSPDTSLSREGYFVLRWEPLKSVPPGPLLLQQSRDPEFSSYQQWDVTGSHQFTQSGLENGVYHFRLQDGISAGLATSVRVEHHSLSRALLFFTLGCSVFVILLFTISLGRRSHPRDGGG